MVSTHQGLIPAHAGKTAIRPTVWRCPWAHPRSRGENHWRSRRGSRGWGSSPLMRGKPVQHLHGRSRHGLIPAHAGKTHLPGARHGARRAHPRSRGENPAAANALELDRGSSPLTRGKPHRVPGQRGQRGLIPAHAGKTSEAIRRSCLIWAHPRSRGENRALDTLNMCQVWLIPAHAGKTRRGWMISGCHRAHPRSRGENRSISRPRAGRMGSSPLTRGKREAETGERVLGGLIPAHAGKTRGRGTCRTRPAAHPRSRGENWLGMGFEPLRWGSSPLTRGKLLAEDSRIVTWGLIPAHAGKTGAARDLYLNRGAHPRSRGENRSCP